MLTIFAAMVPMVLLFTVLLTWSVGKYKRQKNYEVWGVVVVFFAICVIATVGGFLGGLIEQHSITLALPYQIEALNRTVEEQTAYISTDEIDLGRGLEGAEIKREILDAIRERNNLIARVETINRSPWWLFKVDLSRISEEVGE